MRRFAEIAPETGLVRCVFDWPLPEPSTPEYEPGVALGVDVTGLDPEPEHGFTYLDGEFTPPEGWEPPEPPAE